MVLFMPVVLSAVTALLSTTAAQQAGKINNNDLMPFPIKECKADGTCTANEKTKLSLDSNWRWTHAENAEENCYTSGEWKKKNGVAACEDGRTRTCALECAVGAWPMEQWAAPYGVNQTKNGAVLGYVTQGPYSINVGSRLFITEDGEYKQFNLIGNEVAVTVDMSKTECGLNGAVYFVEMDKRGDKGVENNDAGAPYGTGYCDALCPQNLKWIKGKANIKPRWEPNQKDPQHQRGKGGRGICCAELDLWEAHKWSFQLALHPMEGDETQIVCEGDGECGSIDPDAGPTDRTGCTVNPYRMGHKRFYGPGPDYDINTNRPFTIVTEFRGDQNGDLHGMYQYYYQRGKKIAPPEWGFGDGNAMTEASCKNMQRLFPESASFFAKGGMHQLSKALKRGMTMVVSFWDDMETNMAWLDAGSHGRCEVGAGDPKVLQDKHPDAKFRVGNVMVGPIGSTHKG